MKQIDLSAIKNGILCLTFDDCEFEDWQAAIPTFAKYGAHASFFVYNELDARAIATMHALLDAGHTVGLHTLHHEDAPPYFEAHGADAYFENELLPQLDICRREGLEIASLAYPNNRRTDETDAYLSSTFRHFRAGWSDAAEGEEIPRVGDMKGCRLMRGFGIGAYYKRELSTVIEMIRNASRENRCITFFSHGINDSPNFVSMERTWLEPILSAAKECGMAIVGFDELP